jgi:hypothetical protein
VNILAVQTTSWSLLAGDAGRAMSTAAANGLQAGSCSLITK